MESSETTKYYIHANLRADGVVERSDVVGAIFGQTEGLLGDDLDLRDLQKASKISRMEVEVESQNGRSFGTITIGSSLDKVETAVLAASLETIERIGPCNAEVEIEAVEDVRAAKRKRVVERAKYILTELFDESSMDTEEILNEVRETVRASEISTYAGLPAGPNVEKSDAILIVEGRADVLNLLKYGVKNAVGVEGTNVPDEIREISKRKTVTTFLDSDRGGDLIFKELGQVAEIDYVAEAPEGRCVEDLTQKEVMKSLRNKVPYDVFMDELDEEGEVSESEIESSSSRNAPDSLEDSVSGPESEVTNESELVEIAESTTEEESDVETSPQESEPSQGSEEKSAKQVTKPEKTETEESDAETDEDADSDDSTEESGKEATGIDMVGDEVVVSEFREGLESLKGTDQSLLLDSDGKVLGRVDTDDLRDELNTMNGDVESIIVGGEITQQTLDIASNKKIDQVVGTKLGYVAKKPLDVKVVTEADI